MRNLLLALALTLAGCTEEDDTDVADTETDSDTDTDTDTDSDTDTDTDTDTDSDTDTDTDSDTDTDTDTDSDTDCAAIPTFEDGRTPLYELHVDPTGSDGGDGSLESPYATVGRAVAEATPGAAIRIHPGTYGRTNIADLRGTEDAPIWIGGAPDEERPVFTGGNEGLHLSNVSHVILHDVIVRDTSSNGINIDDGGQTDNPEATHHVIVRDVEILDIGGSGNQDCLKLSGLYDYWVLDSVMDGCGGGISGSGVDHVGCHDGVLARNTIRNTSGSAFQVKGGSTDVDIRWNVVENFGERGVNMGGSTGYEFFRPPLSTSGDNAEARRIHVRGNLFRGGVAAMAFVGCDACTARQNTIIDPGNWVIRILQETRSDGTYTFVPSRNGELSSNLVVLNRSDISRWINVGDGTAPDTFTWEQEWWVARDDLSLVPDLPGTVIGGRAGGVDPLVDGDGVPEAGSPAVGAGLASLRADRMGNCYVAPPTVGSVEVASPE